MRGRPKGSKNKPKPAPPPGTPAERFARVMAAISQSYDLSEDVIEEAFSLSRRLEQLGSNGQHLVPKHDDV